ncbi:SMC-Scp complex subunit ScpB [Aliikangiella coralliicola]|uniref:SMC-Scp complex subunit ScpB n=1 Tax=Aliikangiella coralliicola TaxID=2592383 RepID=A0A545UBB4_9GAMM|nr:SMC-Scp complex subunit ScpB [Aliikangiella coralliicola]
MDDNKLKNILEAALMAINKPMSIEQMTGLFEDEECPPASRIKEALSQLQQDCEGRGIELKDVASGYRYQARQDYAEWIGRLWEEKPAKYSRAYLETLALIAYRQPVTRAEIEEVRGVGVSSNIVRTMLEREWIRVVGHRDVPGRPALYATTKQFLDYFNMKSLDELPSLAEIKDLDDLNPELELTEPGAEDSSDISAESDSVAEFVDSADIDSIDDSDINDGSIDDDDIGDESEVTSDSNDEAQLEVPPVEDSLDEHNPESETLNQSSLETEDSSLTQNAESREDIEQEIKEDIDLTPSHDLDSLYVDNLNQDSLNQTPQGNPEVDDLSQLDEEDIAAENQLDQQATKDDIEFETEEVATDTVDSDKLG